MSHRSRTLSAPGSLLWTLVLFCLACSPEANDRPWNVLVIVADDLGVDLLGAYGRGSDVPATPSLDALAAQGVLFRKAWTNPLCSSTRATIQTGRYSFRTEIGWIVVDSGRGLSAEETTLPEVLSSRAPTPYATGAFGKWHLGSRSDGGVRAPNLAGYSHFEGTLFNLGPGPRAYFDWRKHTNGQETHSTRYATTDTVDSALGWIRTASEPWFAYVAFHAPHVPVHAPPQTLHTVDLKNAAPPDADPWPYARAMIEAMDTEIGRLLGGIRPQARARTVILFLGDNGTGSGITRPPFLPSHAKPSLYEGGIHVPLIVSGAIVEQPGRESTALVNSTDLFSTVAELAGVKTSALASEGKPLDSVSLVPYLENPETPPRRKTVFAEKFFPNHQPPKKWAYAIRDQRYKLIRTQGAMPEKLKGRWSPSVPGPEEFYDLERDPFERMNLISGRPLSASARESYEELQRRLEALLEGRSVIAAAP